MSRKRRSTRSEWRRSKDSYFGWILPFQLLLIAGALLWSHFNR